MDIVIAILAFLFLVGLIITIHEGGHFLVGKWSGMKMLEFSIGFGNKLYETTFGKDKTKFTLRMIPLGGYVKPLDESAVTKEEWAALSEEDKNRSFSRTPKWKKFAMVAAGPLANFILAFLMYFLAMSFIGTKVSPATIGEVNAQGVFATSTLKEGDVITKINGDSINHMGEVYPILINSMIKGDKVSFDTSKGSYEIDFSSIDLKNFSTQDPGKMMGFYFTGTTGDVLVNKVLEDGPADKSGLRKGDIITKINGESINDTNKTVRRIQANANKNTVFTVKRQSEVLDIKIIPEANLNKGIAVGKIGASFDVINENNTMTYKYGVVAGMVTSFNRVIDASYTTLISIKKLVTGQISPKAISGPIAIADYSGKSAQRGIYYYVLMIASISIAIGVFNLLPVPTLDGGHLAQYTIEALTGREIPQKILNYFQYAGFGLLIGVSVFSLLNDIFKYII